MIGAGSRCSTTSKLMDWDQLVMQFVDQMSPVDQKDPVDKGCRQNPFVDLLQQRHDPEVRWGAHSHIWFAI